MGVNSKSSNRDRNRYYYLYDVLMHYKETLGERLIENKKILGNAVCLIDPHTHSTHSDGRGSVSDNYEVAMTCGLDYVYITDHNTVEPKKYARMLEGISWGQETREEPHIVLLHPEHPYVPEPGTALHDILAGARDRGSFAFVAHPAGQGTPRESPEEILARLRTIGPVFAMEVLNGIFQVFRSWDVCDRLAVKIWDRLLREGRHVAPIGTSDAHEPFGIGTAWTGVYVSEVSQNTITAALRDGNCFASEAPLLRFGINGRPMGAELVAAEGDELLLQLQAVDSAGLRRISLIGDGRVIHSFAPDGEHDFSATYPVAAGHTAACYRVEVVAEDDRRAFSGPIYTIPEKGVGRD
ncbi:MAG: CehA/McbA family metallohydrolase [Victivallales bacterium]|nr:CehA/McbA family metallohydrolase [Victivallales bacterium]